MEKHTITQADLDGNPELAKIHKVGDEVKLPIDSDVELDLENEEKLVPEEDLTKARDERCDAVVKTILTEMLDKELLFKDRDYLITRLKQYLEYMVREVVIEHATVIFAKLERSLDISFDMANEKIWEKNKDQISLKDIDDLLKK